MKKHGFTLVELLVGLAVGGILILMIGAISTVSQSSYSDLRKEAEVYSDIFYGLNLIRHSVRNLNITDNLTVVNNTLTAGNLTFKKENSDFIFKDVSNGNTTQYIVSNAQNLNFTVSSITNATTNQTLVNITLSGKKYKVPFNFNTTIMRRN